MSQKTASTQTQQNGATPKMGPENMVEGWFSEWEKLEQKQMELAQGAIDEAAKLFKAQLDYQMKLAAEWRNLTLATTKQATAFMNMGR